MNDRVVVEFPRAKTTQEPPAVHDGELTRGVFIRMLGVSLLLWVAIIDTLFVLFRLITH